MEMLGNGLILLELKTIKIKDMKTKNHIILGITLLGYQFLFGQLQITTQGRVGIGTNTPWVKLHVDNGSAIIQNNGRLCRIVPWNSIAIGANYGVIKFWEQDAKWNRVEAKQFYTVSDESLKASIQPIKEPIQLLKDLEGVYFKYKNDSVILPFEKGDEFNYGFIAQEVEKVLPEIVKLTDEGIKAVDYSAIIPILVEGFKSQQKTIENQQQLLDSLKSQVENCCQADSQQYRISNEIDGDNGGLPINPIQGNGILFQNSPNPFKELTVIKYQIKENFNQASIVIFDMQGLLLKNIPLKNDLKGEVIIKGNDLKPGMYIYSLLVDNREVDTKRMILLD